MDQLTLLLVGVVLLALGVSLGYWARQSLAKKRAGTIEQTLQKKIEKAKQGSEAILAEAKEKAQQFLVAGKKENEERFQNILSTERLLLKRENFLNQRTLESEKQQKDFKEKVEKLKEVKENLEAMRKEALEKLEKIAGLKKSEAKAEMLSALEREYEGEVSEKIRKLELEGESRYEKKAKEILATAIQKYGLSQAQEITTTTFNLPSEEIKGRIIGKEGRNIRTLERMTGVEIVVDETPESVIISGFDPVRRQIAKMAL